MSLGHLRNHFQGVFQAFLWRYFCRLKITDTTSREYHLLLKIQMTKQYLAMGTPLDARMSFLLLSPKK